MSPAYAKSRDDESYVLLANTKSNDNDPNGPHY